MASSSPRPVAVPDPERARTVIAPPEDGPGNWAGAPSACLSDGMFYLAYRLRRPLGEGRGHAVVVARSADGIRFDPLVTITKEEMGTESLERPALARTEDGAWRLYLSCATTGTKHWRVELLEADDPAGFDPRTARVVLPGSDRFGVKDPVIVHTGGKWHLWASCHPLDDPHATDRMVTDHATSADGLEWTWQGTVLSGRPGLWDARGARVTAVVLDDGRTVAYYDGRASAAENYEERTGVALGDGFGILTAHGTEPAAASPYAGHGLRYVCPVALPGGGHRFYYELTRLDGAHDLCTEVHDGPLVGGGLSVA
ncbi:hypothetical protein DPM19_04355 [Actinomadura craniellae]|uniref:Glycosyl hydrolase family 32 N-terminal domain-containing protein n=1 Tax=Actinomadura craniellae TaxID=2231787 RepID=A0A365HAQ1_9ACTN|nr:hypothetical protein [Actinomadura craniellae]RAY16161.1 hypothetical protein DPM19_04355 [Actinomadura craniellae]